MRDDEYVFWQMNRAMTLEANIFQAMDVYARKSGGQQANLVLVNPTDLDGKTIDCVGFEVQAVKTVLQGMIWVGRKNDGENPVC